VGVGGAGSLQCREATGSISSSPSAALAKSGAAWSHLEMNPQLVALAKRLRRRNPKTGERKSLRSIAAELAQLGHVNINGRPFAAQSIQAMVSSASVRGLGKGASK
jgi:hypothetical protein